MKNRISRYSYLIWILTRRYSIVTMVQARQAGTFTALQTRNASRHTVRFIYNSPRLAITYFIHGLIIIIPLAVTLWILLWAFNLIDNMLDPVLTWAVGRSIPGLGFGVIVMSVIVIGYVGGRFGRRKIFDIFEANVVRIPVLGSIYGGARQILESFTTSSGSKFLDVIFMEFPRKGIYTVGLVTSEIMGSDGNKMLNVFIPTAPNPTSGFLQIVPEADVVKTSLSVNDAMKLIISAGKVTRQDIADILRRVPEPESKGKVLKA